MTHIPYKGTRALADLADRGRSRLTFANIPAILPHVKSGRLRPLASTGSKRAAMMPDVPTMKEAGVERRRSDGVVRRARARGDAARDGRGATRQGRRAWPRTIPEMRETARTSRAPSRSATAAEEFASILREEVAKWAEVVKVSGAKAD